MHVQFGCGFTAPDSWLNFDSSPTLRWERLPILGSFYTKNAARFPKNVRYGDIVRGLPLQDASCEGVFASHVLEHLSLNEFHRALENTFRLLAPGGLFRLVVPDLEMAGRRYVTRLDNGDPQASVGFLEQTGLGHTHTIRGFIKRIYSSYQTSHHLWMWDQLSLTDALQKHGFIQIRRCRFNDSGDPMFAAVEDLSRFENDLAMEARKPSAL